MERQLIQPSQNQPLSKASASALKGKIMSLINVFEKEATKTKVLKILSENVNTGATTNDWKTATYRLEDLERHELLSRRTPLIMNLVSAMNTAWLAYPAAKSLMGQQVCMIEPLDQVVPVVEIGNLLALTACAISAKTARERTYRSPSRWALNGWGLMYKDYPIARLEKDFESFPEAIKFLRESDDTINRTQLKRIVPRVHSLHPTFGMLAAAWFFVNLLPATFCAPGLFSFNQTTFEEESFETTYGRYFMLGGGFLSMLNWTMAFMYLTGYLPGSNRQVPVDIRDVINTIQDHLDQEDLNTNVENV
jgi:hypothetical protein